MFSDLYKLFKDLLADVLAVLVFLLLVLPVSAYVEIRRLIRGHY